MSQQFLPEGRLLTTPANRMACASVVGLRRAMEREEILEGTALLSDTQKGLVVSVGPYSGYIPYAETALGLTEGTVREIAVLSRVGKAVSFTVTDIQEKDGRPHFILSRKRAQQQALAYFEQLPPGKVIPATVTHLESFGVFVDIGCGLASMIGVERVSVARIRHPNQRFRPGQEIWAIVWEQDRLHRHIKLTHRELLGTWEENATAFEAGMTIPGIVRGVMDYGLFIELAPNLSGLAEPHGGIREGDRVSVYIKSMFSNVTKCKLLIINKLSPAPPCQLRYWLPKDLFLDQWRYAPELAKKSNYDIVFTSEED